MASMLPWSLFGWLLGAMTSSTLTLAVSDVAGRCHDRFGILEVEDFNRRACATCFAYIVINTYNVLPSPDRQDALLLPDNFTILVHDHDWTNSSAAHLFCNGHMPGAPAASCADWLACCNAARDCCLKQLQLQRQLPFPAAASNVTSDLVRNGSSVAETGLRSLEPSTPTPPPYCHSTWDGYSCWQETQPNTDIYQTCPAYMKDSLNTRSAVKTCTINGTWFVKQPFSWEWTDYTRCVDKQSYVTDVNISLMTYSLSAMLLIPALIIFCLFRELRIQGRIRVHVNFFLSLTFNCIANLIWYRAIHYDLLVSPFEQTVILQNPVWCRAVSFAKIYFTSSTYFWMFCEGLFLHKLIVNTFEPPTSLIAFYLFGWLSPSVASVSYAALRHTFENEQCWMKSIGDYQWLIYAPNLFCLVMNFIFLCNIIRILVFKLYSHPNEPSNFRRGVKAAFMLIPLFGLQLFLTIYRPQDIGSNAVRVHEVANSLTTGSQGAIVALLFCFFNAEVMSRLRSALPCLKLSQSKNRSRFVSTQLTLAEVRHSLSGSLTYHVTSDPCHSPTTSRLLVGTGCAAADGQLSYTASNEVIPAVSACSSLSADELSAAAAAAVGADGVGGGVEATQVDKPIGNCFNNQIKN